jgi:CRP-like cAMP-binding protein
MSATPITNLMPMKAVAILNRVPLFNLLTTSEKQNIAESVSLFYHIPADEEFIVLGEMDDGFFVLLSGSAVVIHSGEELTHISAGDFVGETGFMGNNRRSASVVSKTDIITLKFTRKNFQVLPIRVREIIKDHIIEGLVERVELLNLKVIKEIKLNR